MNKDSFEKMCRRAGILPVMRMPWKLGEIFIADGFQAQPYPIWHKLGVDSADEFPMGAYCTVWMVARDDGNLDGAVPLLFDSLHTCSKDGEESHGWSLEDKKRARINQALIHAADFLENRDRIRSERPHINDIGT